MVKLSFRVSDIEQIAIDAHAKQADVSRSEFCRIAVKEKLERAKKEDEKKKEDSEFQKILSILNSLNNSMIALTGSNEKEETVSNERIYTQMMGGFRTVCRGLIATNPDSIKTLKTIFKDQKIWEGL